MNTARIVAGLAILFLGGAAMAQTTRYTRVEATSGQPIVTDAQTGLIWQGCPLGMTASKAACTGSATLLTWAAALDACQDSTWGGKTDWYLPDIKELRTILDDSRTGPAANADAFPGTPSTWLWSSTPNVYDEDCSWTVHFGLGNVGPGTRTAQVAVRCVRRGP